MSGTTSPSSFRCRLTLAAVLAALMLTLSACGSPDGSGQQEQNSGSGESVTTQSDSQQSDSQEPADSGATETEGNGTTEAAGGREDEVRDGTWQVDDAGTVAFQFTGNGVELQNVSPNSGWDQRVAERQSDEIEVHFTRNDTDWKFEAEMDGDQAEISRERDTQPADSGSYQVLDAAEVEFSSGNGSLSLGSVGTKSGWKVTKRDASSDDIGIDFAKDNSATAEFEVERSNGQTKLEISQKVSGPVPN